MRVYIHSYVYNNYYYCCCNIYFSYSFSIVMTSAAAGVESSERNTHIEVPTHQMCTCVFTVYGIQI